jgi:hypothetical protein
MTRKDADAAFADAVKRYQARCSAELKYTTWDRSTVAERGMWADTIAEVIMAAVAGETERCAAVIKIYQSPRSGILLARQPGVVIAQILEEIEGQPEPPK